MTIEEARQVLRSYPCVCQYGQSPYDCNDKDGCYFGKAIRTLIDTEQPTGECKSCKYYHPYFKQFSNEARGDGYCVIARMTPEGMTTINCNDEFWCSDYQKGGETNETQI